MTDIQPAILALLVITAGLGLLVFAVVTTTAFIKVSVVLFLVRNALGTQSIPPNIVLYGAALILTAFTSAPIFEQSYDKIADLQLRYQTLEDFVTAAKEGRSRCEAISRSSPMKNNETFSCPRPNVSGQRRCAAEPRSMILLFLSHLF